MRSVRVSAAIVLASLLGCATSVWAGESFNGGLSGRVLSQSSPLPVATVYAYATGDLKIRRVETDDEGSFLFAELPAGLYKIIAFKRGFLPAVVMLNRINAEARQFLQLQLTDEETAIEQGEVVIDFWSVREQIPGDVLRDWQLASLEEEEIEAPSRIAWEARLQAMTGLRESAGLDQSQVHGGVFDVHGSLYRMQVGIAGNFWTLDPYRFSSPGEVSTGQATSMSVNLAEASSNMQVSLSSTSNELSDPRTGLRDPIALQRHSVSWSQEIGQGRSAFSAQYLEENNFYRYAVTPVGVPAASRLWNVEGSYFKPLGHKTSLQTGLRYRTRQTSASRFALPAQRVDLYGGGDLQAKPSMKVGYGLYSTMNDGRLSFTPRGELVLRFGSHWSAAGVASYRVRTEEDPRRFFDFFAENYDQYENCQTAEDSCYEVVLTREYGEGQILSVGAAHRKYGETMRLYFSNDIFGQLESLFLVRGDEVPELQFAVSRRVGPSVLTKLTSNVGAGGGGVLWARDRRPYENEVAYLVTSLDTLFERSSTGVVLSFHHIEQALSPLRRRARLAGEMEQERLQLILTQDLALVRRLLATDLALQLNMEVSRGSTVQATYDDELLKRFMGGVAVKF